MWGECVVCVCVCGVGVLCAVRVCGVFGGLCGVVCLLSCGCTFVWCV